MKVKDKPDILITFEDENLFNKRLETLRTYNKIALKDVYFKELELEPIQDNLYKINLTTDKKFKAVYGQIYILCKLEDNILTIIDMEPVAFLNKAFMVVLDTYKGIPVADEATLKKIMFLGKLGRI